MVNNKSEQVLVGRPRFLVAIATILLLAPFIDKALHIDDPMYFWAAEQILAHPLDFYGFQVNWNGYLLPMHEVNQNPPLVSYFMAGAMLLFGQAEVLLHLAFLIPTVLLALGVFALARRHCENPLLAALFAISTPAMLVSSTNMMSDTLMLCLFTWSTVYWVRGIDSNSNWLLATAGLLAALAIVSKYFAISLVPLLAAYGLVRTRKIGRWVLFLGIPLVFVLAYQALTKQLYGSLHLSAAASYALAVGEQDALIRISKNLLTGLSYTGGCLVGILFFTPWLWSKRQILAGSLLFATVALLLLSLEAPGGWVFADGQARGPGILLQLALFTLTGLLVLALAGGELMRSRSAESWLLFVWVAGVFLFASQVNWTVNARSVYPMVPAVAILLARRLDVTLPPGSTGRAGRRFWPLLPALAIALSVAWADYSLANRQRDAAAALTRKFASPAQQVWFQGHWGFQFYMEARGARAVSYDAPQLHSGDLIVIPMNNTNLKLLTDGHYQYLDELVLNSEILATTMSNRLGAGFYYGGKGPLPYAFGRADPEEYLVFKRD